MVKIKPEEMVSAREGSSVSLDCLLGVDINGNTVDVEDIKLDKISIIWLKDSQTIMFSSRIKLMRKNRLKILDIGREDQGMYQCVVNTMSGETYYATDSIQLNLRGRFSRREYSFLLLFSCQKETNSDRNLLDGVKDHLEKRKTFKVKSDRPIHNYYDELSRDFSIQIL